MSSDSLDNPTRSGVASDAAAKPAGFPAAGKLAVSAAAVAGADAKSLGLAGSALDTAALVQAGSGTAALATGAAGLAGHASPQLAQALQVASQAQALAQQGNTAMEHLAIAEHPLAGQAVSDFAAVEPQYVPATIDPAEQEDVASAVTGALAKFSDDKRLLRFYSPLKGEKALLIESLSGSSAISDQFGFDLNLISENAAIDLKDLMGKNVSVSVQLADGSEHFINGYVHSFGFSHSDGGFAFYHAQIVPWLSYLKQRVNSRIFQDQSVLEVLDTIFKGDYNGLASYEFRISQTYRPENYLVQYDETDEHFVCRLMEKYGLFYYFEHKPNGHVMVISDDSRSSAFCPPQADHAAVEFNGGNRWHNRDSVTAFAAERKLQPTKVALNTFDFKAPNTMRYVELPTVTQQGDMPTMEIYDGNPAFSYKDKDDGQREARRRLEVLEWQAKVFTGASDCRGLVAGHTFKLLDHHWFDPAGEGDNDFLVLSVQYSARNNYFERGQSDVYRNTFTAIRRKIPYRPRRAHQAPRMPGPQTATVVGPKGTEIHTDQFGRIKVQFHWDRYGRRDERSSCWIRVSQPWAGSGWGTISVPRIGQEVIIDYLEGDPDRPVCTGRLFNADQAVPYALPGGAHMMGFKSRSTPGGGGFCEMVIHDRKGEELINIHSQKDMVTTVQHTQATVVNGPHQTNTVNTGYQTNTVKQYILTTAQTGHIHETAKTNIELTAEDDYIHQTARTNIELVAQTAHLHQTAKQNIELTSQTEHIHLRANTDITLEVGSSKIVLQSDGTILIQGVNVSVMGKRIDLNK